MSTALIREAFETALKTWADAKTPKIPIVWQNTPYKPVTGARYVRAFLLPAQTDSRDLEGRHKGYRGVFQVSVCVPLDQGPGVGGSLAGELETLFDKSTFFPTLGTAPNQFTLNIALPMSQKPGFPTDTHYVIPVDCSYRADL